MSEVRVALVGYGYWGPNIARNVQSLPDVDLVTVCDLSTARLDEASRQFPTARRVTSPEDVFGDRNVDAVVVATPAETHYELAAQALRAGKHALVEKPLAMTVSECEELGRRAAASGLALMVGHTFLYNAAVRWLRDHVQQGDLGDVLYAYAQRLNLGRLRRDVNVLWNLAPHDIAILLFALSEQPVAVRAQGHGYVHADVEDVAFLMMEFPGSRMAHVHVSWLDPRKVRQVTVVGSEKMVIYDDVNVDARIQVYDKGIDVVPNPEGPTGRQHQNLGEFQALVRSGDLLIPKIDFEEPLRAQCREFVESITQQRAPLTGADHATSVVRVLEAASDSLLKGGERVMLRP